MFITIYYDSRDGIEFLEFGKLINGVEGKLIQYGRLSLYYLITYV